jgi:ATP-dependent Clp protease ATP-binding subunit ClpA
MSFNSKISPLRTQTWPNDLASALSRKILGQPAAIDAIVPCIQMHRAMLAPEGRPVGIFLLIGPTGTGKTKTVEALAEVLHGNSKKILKLDCGEFQMDHEVAKLIGAPPGYLGHRETQPFLTQQKVNGATSEGCDLSLLLFDEIEKAAPSLMRLLLGVLDKGALRLGDGTTVNFEKSMIFLTSNLGAREMGQQMHPDFGFEALTERPAGQNKKLERIGMAAVRKSFSPEFINRVDAVIGYRPLDSQAIAAIFDVQVNELQLQIDSRLGPEAFHLEIAPKARRFLIQKGTSEQYGARELKRTMQRLLIQPLASMVAAGAISPGSHIRADLSPRKDKLVLRPIEEDALASAC